MPEINTVTIPLARFEQLHACEIALNRLNAFLDAEAKKTTNAEMLKKYGSFSVEVEKIDAVIGMYKEE